MVRRNKYNVSPAEDRTLHGRTYDSKAEMEYARNLYLLQDAGEIIDFIEQPAVWLGVPENKYRPDFFVVPTSGDTRCYYVDVKGVETMTFKRNKKLWTQYGKAPLYITKRTSPGKFKITEVIHAK